MKTMPSISTGFNSKTTAQDFFDAIDVFTNAHPLSCKGCEKNCCDKQFFIEMDSIGAKKLCGGDMEGFIFHNLHLDFQSGWDVRIFFNRGIDRCRYLDAKGGCGIYDKRLATCRGYICYQRSMYYDILNKVIVNALQNSMIAIYYEILLKKEGNSKQMTDWLNYTLVQLKKSPAYNKDDYNEIMLKECVAYDIEGRNTRNEEKLSYLELMDMEDF